MRGFYRLMSASLASRQALKGFLRFSQHLPFRKMRAQAGARRQNLERVAATFSYSCILKIVCKIGFCTDLVQKLTPPYDFDYILVRVRCLHILAHPIECVTAKLHKVGIASVR